MKLYADSADREAVLGLLRDNLVHGVTTNPKILHRDGRSQADLPELYQDFVTAGAAEVFLQAVGGDLAELRRSGEFIAGLGDRVVVKVPATTAGFAVAGSLVREGVPVLLTAVYSLAQATVAGSLGAAYIAPYLGRLNDAGEDGLATVKAMDTVLAPTATRVLVASVRTPEVAATLALEGISHLTADVPVLQAMWLHPVSEESAAEFEEISNSGR
ncbi:transaldolase family protein [Kineococcus gynurae]|uniref:Transaldolase family protein n=1 Tax=Kineococcus gynurae TaxID=452979 RepID=A0ABV5LW82_9ACTN